MRLKKRKLTLEKTADAIPGLRNAATLSRRPETGGFLLPRADLRRARRRFGNRAVPSPLFFKRTRRGFKTTRVVF